MLTARVTVLTVLLMGLTAASLSCGTGAQSRSGLPAGLRPVAQPAGPGQIPQAALRLPAPSQLGAAPPAEPHAAAYVEADLIHDGDDFDPALPRQNAEVTIDDSALLYPQAGPDDPQALATASYLTYRFDVPGFDRGGLIRLDWLDNGSGLPLNYWAGLSDWENDRWTWFSGTDNEALQTGGLLPYFNNSGTLLLIVLVTSSPDDYKLRSVRLAGGAPQFSLQAAPAAGAPPLEVQFNVNVSSPGEGVLTKIEWDFAGDGVFELDSGLSSEVSHNYAETGIYYAAARVSNSMGEDTIVTRQVMILEGWQHSFGKADLDAANDAALSPAGEIYLVGSHRSSGPGLPLNAAVLKLSADGELLWARGYSSGSETNELRGAALDSDGNLWAAGFQQTGGSKAREYLVQKWSPDGVLLWSRMFGGTFEDRLQDIQLHGSDAYLLGLSQTSALICARMDTGGELLWDRALALADTDDAVSCLTLRQSVLGGLAGVSALGTRLFVNSPTAWRVDFDTDGTLTANAVLDNELGAVELQGQALLYYREPLVGPSHYLIAGTMVTGGVTNIYLLDMPPSGDSFAGGRASGAGFNAVRSLAFTAGGALTASGGITDGADYSGFAARFDSTSGLFLDATAAGGGSVLTSLNGLRGFGAGTLSWGYATDSSAGWQDLPLSSQSYSNSWIALGLTSSEPGYDPVDSLGNVHDLAGELVIDSGGGGLDMFVAYRQEQ